MPSANMPDITPEDRAAAQGIVDDATLGEGIWNRDSIAAIIARYRTAEVSRLVAENAQLREALEGIDSDLIDFNLTDKESRKSINKRLRAALSPAPALDLGEVAEALEPFQKAAEWYRRVIESERGTDLVLVSLAECDAAAAALTKIRALLPAPEARR